MVNEGNFKGRNLAVELKDNHFVLYGFCVDENENGITLQTNKDTGFISFDAIYMIRKRK